MRVLMSRHIVNENSTNSASTITATEVVSPLPSEAQPKHMISHCTQTHVHLMPSSSQNWSLIMHFDNC